MTFSCEILRLQVNSDRLFKLVLVLFFTVLQWNIHVFLSVHVVVDIYTHICLLVVQVCWEKFARYFEVELKDVKLREDYYVMDPVAAVELVDENTICVCAILGSTYNGEFEDVKTLNDLLDKKNKEMG